MDIQHSQSTREWQRRVRQFVDEDLIPWEVEAELNNGVIPKQASEKMQTNAIALGLSRMDAPVEHGGLGMSMVDQLAAWEELGRVTNALCWCFPEAQQWMFEACANSDYQIKNYLHPLMDGSLRECYAITEAESGSHEVVDTKAAACDGGYSISGEKWFVTTANLADFFFIQAKTDNGEDALFFMDIDAPGVTMIENPAFSHTFPSHHPTYQFDNVFVPEKNRVGDEGAGMDYSRSWFRHERLTIAARMLGAATRMIEEATQWCTQRKIQDEYLIDKQATQFSLADSVTELWAAKLMVYEAAAAHDRGDDLKSQHAQCSVVKLYATEMANRVADRCLQLWGGRGYRRDNAVERFYREVRVDRIWEGSSEIQRMVIASALRKRGLKGM
ncbi:MAG: acyl-CoA/acyl-ACP dehydrogenase [Porticoccaceae bacterium]|nr:acyl-CoA/acyl-ACP dehydrogenase [Porticoccaceae bacterium]